MTHNQLDPKVYAITKVQDLVPQGIIKLTLKQGEVNDVKDNVDLMICDYYSDSGEIVAKQENHESNKAVGFLWSARVDENGILNKNLTIEYVLHIAKTTYYNCEFFLRGVLQDIPSEWRIEYDGISDITKEEKEHLCNLLVMRQIDNSTISIRPGKSNKLIGERFKLSVQDSNGDYKVSIQVEVQE